MAQIFPKTPEERSELIEKLEAFYNESMANDMSPYMKGGSKRRHRALKNICDVVSVALDHDPMYGNTRETVTFGCYISEGNDVTAIDSYTFVYPL